MAPHLGSGLGAQDPLREGPIPTYRWIEGELERQGRIPVQPTVVTFGAPTLGGVWRLTPLLGGRAGKPQSGTLELQAGTSHRCAMDGSAGCPHRTILLRFRAQGTSQGPHVRCSISETVEAAEAPVFGEQDTDAMSPAQRSNLGIECQVPRRS